MISGAFRNTDHSTSYQPTDQLIEKKKSPMKIMISCKSYWKASKKLVTATQEECFRPSSYLFLRVQGYGVHVDRRLFFTFNESKTKSDKLIWPFHRGRVLIDMIQTQKAWLCNAAMPAITLLIIRIELYHIWLSDLCPFLRGRHVGHVQIYLCWGADWDQRRHWYSSSWSHHHQTPRTHPFCPLQSADKEKRELNITMQMQSCSLISHQWHTLADARVIWCNN